MSEASTGARPTFDLHTAVEDDGIGSWRAIITRELGGFGGTHGGYVAAIALRAMARLVGDRQRTARSLGLGLLAPIVPGALELRPRCERDGSSTSAIASRLEQDGAVVGSSRALFGSARPSLEYLGLQMPDVQPPEKCEPLKKDPAPDAPAGLLLEHRPAAPPRPLTGSERAEILVWIRLVENRPLDALSLAVLADGAAPALFAHLTSFVPIPSVEITLNFCAVEAAGDSPWVLGVFRTRHAAGGYVVEDGELWTPSGELALLARQLRRILGESSKTSEAKQGLRKERV